MNEAADAPLLSGGDAEDTGAVPVVSAGVRSLRRGVAWHRLACRALAACLLLASIDSLVLSDVWVISVGWGVVLFLAGLVVPLTWLNLNLALDVGQARRRRCGQLYVCARCLSFDDPDFNRTCWSCADSDVGTSPFVYGDHPPVWCRACERAGVTPPLSPITVAAKCRHCGVFRDVELPLAAVTLLGVLSAQQFEAFRQSLALPRRHLRDARYFQIKGGAGDVGVVNLAHPDDVDQPFPPQHAVSALRALWLDVEDRSSLEVGLALDHLERRLGNARLLRRMPVLVRQAEVPVELQRLLAIRCGPATYGVTPQQALRLHEENTTLEQAN